MFKNYEEINTGEKRRNEELSPEESAGGGGAASSSRGEGEVRNFVDEAVAERAEKAARRGEKFEQMSLEKREKAKRMMERSHEMALQLDGHPKKKPKITEVTLDEHLEQEAPRQAEDEAVEENDDNLMLELYEEEDEVFMASKTGTLVWHKLTEDEKHDFEKAKTEALIPWIENNGIEGWAQTHRTQVKCAH